ncbi:MAG: hypothetical protein L6461_14345 [Anaerolineae bacterium]|nr:hypothetical protein [Anaerolineae bacterium]
MAAFLDKNRLDISKLASAIGLSRPTVMQYLAFLEITCVIRRVPDMLGLLKNLRKTHHAELTVISDNAEALALAQSPIQLPAQLFCCHLTRARGFDTEAPRTIRKMTETY